jgi:hypothetical protein
MCRQGITAITILDLEQLLDPYKTVVVYLHKDDTDAGAVSQRKKMTAPSNP